MPRHHHPSDPLTDAGAGGFPARTVSFACLVGLTLAGFWASLTRLIAFSFQHEHYSHIIVVPLLGAGLVVLERRRIFSRAQTHWRAGLGLLLGGVLVAAAGRRSLVAASENDQLSVGILGVVLVWLGAFVLCFGLRAAHAALFPLLFLLLMVPIPDALLNFIIEWLQRGSADFSHALLEWTGVPVFRTGFTLALPGLTIEVARECSGIRSSLALVVMSLVVGHLVLRRVWTKAALVVVTVPLVIVKNGIRIAALSLLSIYVDPRFLTGDLHQHGGVVFFVLAILLILPVIRLLQKAERSAPLRFVRSRIARRFGHVRAGEE
jgi:exosortase